MPSLKMNKKKEFKVEKLKKKGRKMLLRPTPRQQRTKHSFDIRIGNSNGKLTFTNIFISC